MSIVYGGLGVTVGLFFMALLALASLPWLLGNGMAYLPSFPSIEISMPHFGDGGAAVGVVDPLPLDLTAVRTALADPPYGPSILVVWHAVGWRDHTCAKPKIAPSDFGFTDSKEVLVGHGVSAFRTGTLRKSTDKPCAVPFALIVPSGVSVPGQSYPIVGIGGVGCAATSTPIATTGSGVGHFSMWCGPPGGIQKVLTTQTFSAYAKAIKDFDLIRPTAEVG